MSFRENLLKKIRINDITRNILKSMGPGSAEKKTDRNAVRELLEMSLYHPQRERDMDIYVLETGTEKKRILVLDNDLPIYHTTVADVGMRKSPTIREMVSIRNAMKILSDADVVASKKEASVRTIQEECLSALDLSFTLDDLQTIARDGAASLSNGYSDGLLECLVLFAEILDMDTDPFPFRMAHCRIIGRRHTKNGADFLLEPLAVYSMIHNTLKFIKRPLSSRDKEHIRLLDDVVSGKETADAEGPEVFDILADMAASEKLNS